jgi:hypothetical protein
MSLHNRFAARRVNIYLAALLYFVFFVLLSRKSVTQWKILVSFEKSVEWGARLWHSYVSHARGRHFLCPEQVAREAATTLVAELQVTTEM